VLLMLLLGGCDTQTLALLPGLKFAPLLLCKSTHTGSPAEQSGRPGMLCTTPQKVGAGAGNATTTMMARQSGLLCTAGHAVDTQHDMLSCLAALSRDTACSECEAHLTSRIAGGRPACCGPQGPG